MRLLSPWRWPASLSLLFQLFILFTSLQLSLAVIPAGELRIRENAYLVEDRLWHYSSKITLPNGQTFTDAQGRALVELAFNDMTTRANVLLQKAKLAKQRPLPKNPSAMTALFIGSEVYLSSSMTGRGIFDYASENTPPAIREAFVRCMLATGTNSKHRNDARCGEPLAALMYFRDHPRVQSLNLAPGRVITYGIPSTDMQPQVLKPCRPVAEKNGELPKWGCATFLQATGLTAISENIPPDARTLFLPKDTEFARPNCRV